VDRARVQPLPARQQLIAALNSMLSVPKLFAI
jgi:hypothetical protein